ncbi:hypothetical protein G6F43_009514 [Rhizopus delemar]|nr:hypothetical protein G6F43_009514 [Rhizopus delemar]
MASINDNVYARVREKMKEHDFTDQEIKAIDDARDQLRSHTRIGGFTGATTAFILGKVKNYKPFQLLLLAGGGFLLGTQTGFVTGALAGVKSINHLPNPQRIINVMKEIQEETIKKRQMGSIGSQSMASQELYNQNSQDKFSPDLSDYTQNEKEAWESTGSYQPDRHDNSRGETVMMDSQPQSQPQPQPQTQQSAWDKIRAENLPNSTWAKVRLEAQRNPVDEAQVAKARAERANRLREDPGFGQEELPRTREDYYEKKRLTARKNQFGDVLE